MCTGYYFFFFRRWDWELILGTIFPEGEANFYPAPQLGGNYYFTTVTNYHYHDYVKYLHTVGVERRIILQQQYLVPIVQQLKGSSIWQYRIPYVRDMVNMGWGHFETCPIIYNCNILIIYCIQNICIQSICLFTVGERLCCPFRSVLHHVSWTLCPFRSLCKMNFNFI